MNHYQNQSCPEAVKLLTGDEITYSVLMSILQGTCTDIYTNHESVIICYSFPPYPVWVWCKNPGNREDIDSIAQCLKSAFPMEKGHSYNLSYELLAKLKDMDAYFYQTSIKMGLLSYRLDRIQKINYPCGGWVSLPEESKIPYLSEVWHAAAFEMEGHDLSAERCESRVRACMDKNALFAWRNDAGEIVALTVRGDVREYGKVSMVYTLPQHRRKGYAINLVHHVTQTILADGLIPILYTNADYRASNECYRKIGYEEVGSLCTVKREAAEE